MDANTGTSIDRDSNRRHLIVSCSNLYQYATASVLHGFLYMISIRICAVDCYVYSHHIVRMFETRSDVMAMFEQFRTVDKADLGSSRSLENHALLVMNALDEAIANMDDPEYLIELLLTTGKSHQRFENFSTAIFLVLIYLNFDSMYQTLCVITVCYNKVYTLTEF